MTTLLFAFGMPGLQELMIIALIVLLLFGGARLPSLMRNLGSSAREFKKGVQGAEEDEDDDETTPTGIDKDE